MWMANKVRNMGFFLIIFICTKIWLSNKMLAPQNSRFNTYPAFVPWLFISNMIQLFLMRLSMIEQNLQSFEACVR